MLHVLFIDGYSYSALKYNTARTLPGLTFLSV